MASPPGGLYDSVIDDNENPLFDLTDRADRCPRRYAEDAFSFLNRVQGHYWDAVRELLERWFNEYSADAAPDKARDLRARYRDNNAHQHHAAWWELYIHQLLHRLHPGAMVGVEEDAGPGVSRPDFRVASGDERFFVEAMRSFAWVRAEKGRNPRLEARVLDAINEVRSEDFAVHAEFTKVGATEPGKRDVQRPLVDWLATLDADEALATYRARGASALGSTHLTPDDGWNVLVEARPLDPARRGTRCRLIEIGPAEGGWVIDDRAIRDGLREKGKRYDLDG